MDAHPRLLCLALLEPLPSTALAERNSQSVVDFSRISSPTKTSLNRPILPSSPRMTPSAALSWPQSPREENQHDEQSSIALNKFERRSTCAPSHRRSTLPLHPGKRDHASDRVSSFRSSRSRSHDDRRRRLSTSRCVRPFQKSRGQQKTENGKGCGLSRDARSTFSSIDAEGAIDVFIDWEFFIDLNDFWKNARDPPAFFVSYVYLLM